MLQALEGGHEVLPVAEEGGPLPDRARQRFRRQYLAHPDDQDGQGLCRGSRTSSADVKELKVVSTGTDVAAQIAAIDNFINAGYDAILTIAVNPTAFTPVIKRANKAGVVLVPFDNVLDTDEVMQVNEDQLEMGRHDGPLARPRTSRPSAARSSKCAALPGNSVDRDRHLGFREVMEAPGNKYEIIEVVGNWDDGTAQKVDRRRGRRAQEVRRHVRAGRLDRRGARADGCRPSLHPGGGRSRERLPQALRRACRRTACCAPRPASRRASSPSP